MRYIFILLCWLILASPVWASGLSYDLDLELDVENSTLYAEAKLDYLNSSPKALKQLYFRLDANTQAELEVQEVTNAEGLVLPARHYRYDYLGSELEDPVFYEVFLSKPLETGERVQLKFKYIIRHLPQHQGSYYLLDDANRLGLGAWYPRLIPFRDGQWQLYERLPADYKVSARSTGKLYVISPLAPVSINNATRAYQYSAEQVREISLIYTPNLLLRSTEESGISIRFYYDASLQKWSAMTLDLIVDALKYYRERYSAYPVKRLTVVSIEDSLYPIVSADQLIVMRNSFSPESDLSIVRRRLAEHIAYGLAQQFWGYQVAQDPEHIPWIEQGLALYDAQQYIQQKDRKNFLLGDALSQQYLRAARQGWSTRLQQPRRKLEKMPLNSFEVLAQGKGYTIFRLLERMLSKQTLEQAENRLLQQYRNRYITDKNIQQTLESVSGKDLGWFFAQWVNRGDTLDYGIQSVTQRQGENGQYDISISIQKLGQITMPITIGLKMRDGTTQFKLWDGKDGTARLNYTTSQTVREVTLDPSEGTPDIDRSNNRYQVGGIVR